MCVRVCVCVHVHFFRYTCRHRLRDRCIEYAHARICITHMIYIFLQIDIYMCVCACAHLFVMDVFCVLRDAGNSAPRNSCNYRASLVHLHSPSSKNCKILQGAFLGQNVCHASVMVCGHWHLGAWRLHIDQCVDTFLPTFHKSSGWMCEYVHNYIHRSRHLYLWCLIMFDPLMSYAS